MSSSSLNYNSISRVMRDLSAKTIDAKSIDYFTNTSPVGLSTGGKVGQHSVSSANPSAGSSATAIMQAQQLVQMYDQAIKQSLQCLFTDTNDLNLSKEDIAVFHKRFMRLYNMVDSYQHQMGEDYFICKMEAGLDSDMGTAEALYFTDIGPLILTRQLDILKVNYDGVEYKVYAKGDWKIESMSLPLDEIISEMYEFIEDYFND